MEAVLILPNHLFEDNYIVHNNDLVIIYEHPHYFLDYEYHKLKLAFHFASMAYYYNYIKKRVKRCKYITYEYECDDIIKYLKKNNVKKLKLYDPVNSTIEKEINKEFKAAKIGVWIYETPMFLFDNENLYEYNKTLKSHDKYYFKSFYIWARRQLCVFIKNEDKPLHDKWSFDKSNRDKFSNKPKHIYKFKDNSDKYINYAKKRVNKEFKENIGDPSSAPAYAGALLVSPPSGGELSNYYLKTTFDDIKKEFNKFLKDRLVNFGKYQDAISSDVDVGYHSMLSPYMNVGMITPHYVLMTTLKNYDKHKSKIHYHSVEGFIRQIIGWREYVRFMYLMELKNLKGNFFNHTNKLPKTLYYANTGITPVDNCIKKVVKYAYAHHIERLMILGNYMLISQIRPKDVFRWFMELFIDSYEWVMYPNVYGMSQLSCGTLMMTRPYFSSSNYIIKMSDYNKGVWADKWDELYKGFVKKNKRFLLTNYSTAMIARKIK